MTQFMEAGHLGGYIVGGDDATHYPDLWRWLVEEQGVRSVIDVGCGEGHAVEFFGTHSVNGEPGLGCSVLGVEGVPQGRASIATHDYTTGPFAPPSRFHLCWCCEFVEHVEERYVPNFLATFACAELVLMTHAEPGQQGYHHVNCQPAAYWEGAMAAIGYELDTELTAQAREKAALNESPYNHFVRSGLAFQSRRPRG